MSYDSTPGSGSRKGLIGAGIVLAILLAMGVFVAVMTFVGDDEPDDPTPTTTPTTKPTPSDTTSSAADPEASICGLEGHQTKGGLDTAPSADWELIGKSAIPSSDTAGPGVTEDSGVRYCFAHTAEGAVMAGANFYSWGEASRNDPTGVVEHGVASGPGYDAALEQASAGPDAPAEDRFVQIRGFRVVTYTEDVALIDYAFEIGAQQGYAHHQLELSWERGDWRLRVGPDGSVSPGGPLPDLVGYVPWSGA